jgi:hypothetical protein
LKDQGHVADASDHHGVLTKLRDVVVGTIGHLLGRHDASDADHARATSEHAAAIDAHVTKGLGSA